MLDRRLALLSISVGLFSLPTITEAEDQRRPCSCCRRTVCHVSAEREEVDDTGFRVRREDVCIPPIRFWWECGPIRRGGKVRTVSKLAQETTKKTVWTYEWNALTICGDCYRDVHRLRCDELGVPLETPAPRVGLPVAVPPIRENDHDPVR